MKKERFSLARNFVLFYGSGMENELSWFDVAIIEPLGQNRNSIRKIQESGTLVFAYLSAVELRPESPDFKLLKPADFLQKDGNPMINEAFGTYLANPGSKTWKNILYHKSGKLLLQDGYDGIFLDTIGDVEFPDVYAQYGDLVIYEAVDILRQIKSIRGDFLLIQNNGLEKLIYHAAGLIDGLCWENPLFIKKRGSIWVKKMLKHMEYLQNKEKIRILLLLETPECANEKMKKAFTKNMELARSIAVQKNFLLYIAPKNYITKVNSPYNLQTSQTSS